MCSFNVYTVIQLLGLKKQLKTDQILICSLKEENRPPNLLTCTPSLELCFFLNKSGAPILIGLAWSPVDMFSLVLVMSVPLINVPYASAIMVVLNQYIFHIRPV